MSAACRPLDHPKLTAVESQRLGSRSLDLMQLVFTPSTRTTNLRDEHLTAAKKFIDDHLKDPDMSPWVVAAGTAISIRYLHELFRSTGETVRQRIIRRRLALAHAELSDPRRASASISAIAADNGFKSRSTARSPIESSVRSSSMRWSGAIRRARCHPGDKLAQWARASRTALEIVARPSSRRWPTTCR